MGEVLILKSIDGHPLTDQFVDTCLQLNEMFIVKKLFSSDRCSIEITFIDEESMKDSLEIHHYISIQRSRNDVRLIEDLLSTCINGDTTRNLHIK